MTTPKKMTMKGLPAADRPVEKALRRGVLQLTDAELLAVIIRSGSARESALTLCQRLLAMEPGDEGLAQLEQQSLEELMLQPGIGPVKACQIKAALQLGRRLASKQPLPRAKITGPDDALLLLSSEMSHLPREQLRVLLLDNRNQVIRVATLSEGGLAAAVLYPRDLFREAVKANAAGLILAHNHPSGDATPSRDDIETTQRLIEAGRMMGIKVLDHLIVARGGSVSLKEKGLLE